MTLTMYQADRNFVTPANDASLYSSLVDDTNGTLNRGNKLGITVNGLIATVNTGQAFIQGRLVEVVKPENVSLPPNSTGKICLTVDLSKTNDVIGQAGTPEYSVKVNQVYLAVVTGEVIQDDLNNGGIVYQLPIGSFNSSTTTATVSVIKNVFNDTGWIDAELANGTTTNGGTGFAQYRVKNGLMIINFYNLNCSKSPNANQILVIPYALRPASPHSQVFSASNFNINTGKAWPVMVTVQSQSTGSVMYGSSWTATPEFTSLTGATGTVIYPIN